MIVTVPPQLSVAVTALSLGAGTWLAHDTAVLAGKVLMVGAVVSCTVMLWLTVALVLPQASVACQLRVKVFEQLTLPEVLSVELIVGWPPQVSEAVGAVKLGVGAVAGQPSTDWGPPCPPIVTTHVL